MLNFFYGLAAGIGLAFASVWLLSWLFGEEGEEHIKPEDCSHAGKGGALRWARWNMPYTKKGKVKKTCGQCGKMQFYTKK